jgi:hypothetical protein
MTSNKLNDVGVLLGFGEKIKTDIDLWLGCMKDDPQCWKQMEEYNKRDVELLEKIYLKLRPWHISHPNLAKPNAIECPKCGSEKLHSRGHGFSFKVGSYTRFQCRSCGGWSRSRLATNTEKKRIVNEN